MTACVMCDASSPIACISLCLLSITPGSFLLTWCHLWHRLTHHLIFFFITFCSKQHVFLWVNVYVMFLLLLLYILLMFIWSWVCRMMYKFGFDGYIRLGMEIVKSDVISLIIREIPACPSVVCLSIQLNIWLSSVWLDIFHQNKCSPGVFLI